MAPGSLAQVLRTFENMFPPEKFTNLIVGLDVGDDAAVYKISDDRAIIFTLDFFTPVVDDPYTYGAIAAANAMSDVYAMGGEVVMALNICGFPTTLPLDIISEIMRGGADKVLEAGGILAGGHTVDDEEPKYGLAVIGFVHPDKVLTRKGAKAGDVLALTKPLGVGLITTVLKSGLAKSEHIEAATQSMLRLNKKAAELINGMGINACTDITGFALLGHATDMALQSDALLRFHLKQIPLLPGAEEYADQWLFPGGTCRNEDAFKEHVKFGAGVLAEYQQLLYTPETSGGLLISVPKENIDELIMLFSEAGEDFRVVGEVAEGSGVEVTR